MTEQVSTELALPTITSEQYPALYVSGGLNPYYQQIRQQVLSEVPDLTTKKGIDRVKSLAAMVSRSKVAIEKPGREYLKQLKEMPKVIEAELRDWNQKMDALRDEVRQPVTELEENEKARIAELDQRIEAIQELGTKATNESPSAEIKLWINELDAITIDDTWSEYQDRAQAAKEAAKLKLESFLQVRLQWELQQAEIARLKAEQEEAQRIERERQIAENARLEAERAAMRKQLEAEQRERAAKDAQLKAERDAVEAQQRLDQERIDAEARQQAAVKQAAEQERQRIAEEQARIKEEADAKAANIEHQREFNREALADILATCPNLTEDQATILLTGIIRRKIRHISIQY